MRGEQLARQWRMLQQIQQQRNGLTAGELAEDIGVSLRTVYRDLEALQQAGFPLYTHPSDTGRRWRFVDGWNLGGSLPLAIDEMVALHLSREMLAALRGTAYFDSLERLLEKIRAALPPEALAACARHFDRFHAGATPQRDYSGKKEIVALVNRAITESLSVDMVYRPLRSRGDTRRRVDPYSLWYTDGTLYLIGRCHLREAVRTFVLDRIGLFHLTDVHFHRPTDFDLDAYTRDSFGVMRDALETVVVRISPQWARYVGERCWHPSQRARWNEDGSLELAFRVAGLDEIKRWILGFGPEAAVLEPEALREAVARDLERALERYRCAAFVSEPAAAFRIGRDDRSRG